MADSSRYRNRRSLFHFQKIVAFCNKGDLPMYANSFLGFGCCQLGSESPNEARILLLQKQITDIKAAISNSQKLIQDYLVSMGAGQTKIDALKLENTNLTVEKTAIKAKPVLTAEDKARMVAIDRAVRLNVTKISRETALLRPWLTKKTTEEKKILANQTKLESLEKELQKLIPVPAQPQPPWTIPPGSDWTPITPTNPPPTPITTTPTSTSQPPVSTPPPSTTPVPTSGQIIPGYSNNMVIGGALLAYLFLRR